MPDAMTILAVLAVLCLTVTISTAIFVFFGRFDGP